MYLCNIVVNKLVIINSANNTLLFFGYSASLGGKVKVSTLHLMAVLAYLDPPSSGIFNYGFSNTRQLVLKFHIANMFDSLNLR